MRWLLDSRKRRGTLMAALLFATWVSLAAHGVTPRPHGDETCDGDVVIDRPQPM